MKKTNDSNKTQKIHFTFGGIDEILPNKLFLSGDDVASNLNLLKENQITHILNLTTTFQNAFDNKFIYKTIRINDNLNESIYKHFNDSFEFIDNAINMMSLKDLEVNRYLRLA